jgi:hypothetical protein
VSRKTKGKKIKKREISHDRWMERLLFAVGFGIHRKLLQIPLS